MPPPSLYSSKPAPQRCDAPLGREHFPALENWPAPSNFQISSYPLNSSYPLKKASLFADFSKSTIHVSIHLRGKILRGKTGFRNLDPWAVFPTVGLEPSYPLKKVALFADFPKNLKRFKISTQGQVSQGDLQLLPLNNRSNGRRRAVGQDTTRRTTFTCIQPH